MWEAALNGGDPGAIAAEAAQSKLLAMAPKLERLQKLAMIEQVRFTPTPLSTAPHLQGGTYYLSSYSL